MCIFALYFDNINMDTTNKQFDDMAGICREIFSKKMHDYGASWRILRPESVTDQILIKAKRIRSLEMKKMSKVDEGIFSEFIAIVNYGVIGLIQIDLGCTDTIDISEERALELYDRHIAEVKKLMLSKNHDYDEAWRVMRISSYTDLILQKIHRTKEIENNNGKTLISEGVDANYQDMINYAIFGLIKLHFETV